ncbi:MAG: AAA family ATPase, partial [Solirubrobacteraceae bacterium]|nr:AAA family ATPase [Solirubrobacteraceae bacterium]
MGDGASPTATGECGLVGRYDELAELDAAVGRLQRRQPQVGLEIVGEAGLGKSSLLSELEVRAEAFGATVLHGRASQFERDLPFGALRTALDGLAHGLDGAATALRHETHDHVRGLLSELARDARVVLVLDDLHWADPATLDLVGALIERPPRGAFLLVVAYRPNQLDGALPPVIATAAARGVLRRIAPRPLDLSCATELLGGQHSHAQVTELHRLCGGNPYFLVETARAVRSGSWRPPASDGSPGEPVAVPPLITGALATELLPLSRDARALIGAAAVLGDPFDIDLAGAVAELDDGALARAVDQLALVGLVRPSAGPRRFRFRHPLTRQAIHDDLPLGSRRLAHRRAAAVLTAAHADTPTIAHHVAQSAEQGDLEAVAVL